MALERLFKDGDELRAVIRGHLYLERCLVLLIIRQLPESEQQSVLRSHFPEKIDRAIALGVLPRDERELLRSINRIRNRFAHEPRAYLPEVDAMAIGATLSLRVRERLANAGRNGPEDFDLPLDFLKVVIVAMCYILIEDCRKS